MDKSLQQQLELLLKGQSELANDLKRRDAELAKRDAEQAKRDAEQAKRDAEQAKQLHEIKVELGEQSAKLDVIQEELKEIKENVLIIKGRVIPIDLAGITPTTQKDLQDDFEKAHDKFLENPQAFDPRIGTKQDPRKMSDVERSRLPECGEDIKCWRRQNTWRTKQIVGNRGVDHGGLVKIGNFLSKIFTVVFNFDFEGHYTDDMVVPAETTIEYILTERLNSDLVKTGNRWT